MVAAIGPGRGPRQLTRGESRRMNLNDDVVYRCRWLGPLGQLHPGRSRSLVRHNDCFHGNPLLNHLSLWSKCRGDRKSVRYLMPGGESEVHALLAVDVTSLPELLGARQRLEQ